MKNSSETKAMMEMFAKNPQKGFEQIYKSFAGPIFRYLKNSFSLTREEAEDLVHSVFLPWVIEPEKFTEINNPAAYLFTSARNAALKHKASRKTCEPQRENISISHEQTVESNMMINSALTTLPEEQKETVVLKIWINMTFEEIARLQNCSLQTVASRYRYAIAKLKELIPWQK